MSDEAHVAVSTHFPVSVRTGASSSVRVKGIGPSAPRATRRHGEPPSDVDIERGLRERAVLDPRAAEILLRWQQRPRQAPDGDELQGLSEAQLEGLYAALLRLSALSPDEQSAVAQGLLAGRV
jgi:hypothetical protein